MKALLFLALFIFSSPSFALSIDQLTDSEVEKLDQGLEKFQNKQYDLAMEELKPIAERGYPSAQIYVGWMHLFGLGIHENVCQGVDWIDQAARQGFVNAQLMMSALLSDVSWGHRPDYQRSYGWLLTAVQNGATDIKKDVYVPLTSIPDLFKLLEGNMNNAEMQKVKQEVADGQFDISTPASKYIVRISEYHVGDYVIPISTCKRLYPD